jgi:transposase-like protein
MALRSEKLKAAIEYLKAGMTYRAAAEAAGLASHGPLVSTIKRHGLNVPARDYKKPRQPELDEAVQMIESGMTYREVAAEFGTTPSNIHRAVKLRCKT